MMKVALALTAILAGSLLSCAGAESPAAPDPRLGAPFTHRERAVLGPDSANVIVIEFSSFTCAHCRTFHNDFFPQLRKRYIDTGKVQWVLINASNHPEERTAPIFLVARSALRKGTYWDLVDSLYRIGQEPPSALDALLAKLPPSAGENLADSVRDPLARDEVAADFAEYATLGIRGTPTFLLRQRTPDGRWHRAILEDLQRPGYFEETLDRLLTKT